MNKYVLLLIFSLGVVFGCKEKEDKVEYSNEKEPMNQGYEALLININSEWIDENTDPEVEQERILFNNINMDSASDFGTSWNSFFVKGVGVIEIPEDGDYYFRMISSGKAGISLNNVDLVIDFGKHDKSEITGRRKLKKGPSVFDFSYYPCEYDPLLVLEWSRDGEDYEVIPDHFFKNSSIVDVAPWKGSDADEEEQDSNQLTEEEIAEGWELLFDGKSTDGWHTYNKPGEIGSRWVVEDGMLKFNGYDKYFEYKVGGKLFYHADINKARDGGLDIVTDEAFENFELRMEWKISENGNSGIFYTVQEIPEYYEGWNSSPEMQVLHDQGQKDGMIRSHRSGDLYDLIPCSERRTKGANEWNAIRIVKNQGKVEHWMNGKMVLSFDLGSSRWKEMIANSKFSPYIDNFGSVGPGKIGLQDHDDTVWFRNIKIKKL